MPTATRNGRTTALAVIGGLLILFLVIPMTLAGLFVKTISDSGCGGTGPTGGAESADARDIPTNYLALYHRAESEYGVPWNVLAGIGKIEADHGRSNEPGVHSGTNFAGAGGPMQFLAGTWASYGVDGNDDGRKDLYDPEDAIPGAAKYLRASGAPRTSTARSSPTTTPSGTSPKSCPGRANTRKDPHSPRPT